MRQPLQIVTSSFIQALQELRANKLRTFLSLLGITIGIFCIIAVFTVLDSMEQSVRKSMSSLGSDVLYVNRRPWVAEGGEFKWWEYLQRPPMTIAELRAIEQRVPNAGTMTICHIKAGAPIKYMDQELEGANGYGVTPGFDKLQNIEIEEGRYLSPSELEGGSSVMVIGSEISKELFNGAPVGKHISYMGRKFAVVGVMKKSGQNMAGFNFDRSFIYSYYAASALHDTRSLDWGNDPFIIVRPAPGVNQQDLRFELSGALRSVRRVQPGAPDNFAINELSQVSKQLQSIFGVIDSIGLVIAFFSILVGAFGVANIMFVTVRERTRIIGLKKAVGARPHIILSEFLLEAVTMCIIGGLIGIVMVLLLSLVMTHVFDFAVTLSFKNIFIGISISAVVGVLAGFIPARAASRLDPVVAIRST